MQKSLHGIVVAEDVELQLLAENPPQSLVQLVEGAVHRPDLIVEPSVHQPFLALAHPLLPLGEPVGDPEQFNPGLDDESCELLSFFVPLG